MSYFLYPKIKEDFMEKIHFYQTSTIYEGTTDFLTKHIIVIEFNDACPTVSEIANGFQILNENNEFVQAEYPEFNTLYRTYDDKPNRFEISDDGSVYVEPEPQPEPEPYVPTLEDIKTQKTYELSYKCNRMIVDGVDIDIDGNTEHFSYKEEDQVNIKEIFDLVAQTNVPMYYHSDGNSCKLYTAEQIIELYSTATMNKMHHVTYFNQLKLYLDTLETKEEVEEIEYGQDLTGEYLDTYNTSMEQAKLLLKTLLDSRKQD